MKDELESEFQRGRELQIQSMQELDAAQQELNQKRQNYHQKLDEREKLSNKSLEGDNLQKLRVAREDLN